MIYSGVRSSLTIIVFFVSISIFLFLILNVPIYAQTFNIAVAGDWGCSEKAEKTAENIQSPELVIANGDLSYKESGDCWFKIIQPFKSKVKISMGDHEYSDTKGGKEGVKEEYLASFNLTNTYYSFDYKNVHILAIDPYVAYDVGSDQYTFIQNDLKNSSSNPNIDWIMVMEHVPMYTSSSKHPSDANIRDIYHPLFDKYGVDIVLHGDNHNYQRTYPLLFNSSNPSTPIITTAANNNSYNDYTGVIYIIAGTGGRTMYEIEGQSTFVANQYDKGYGFLDLTFNNTKTVIGTFYINEKDKNNNLMIDRFVISK